jgi:hypothetical protein
VNKQKVVELITHPEQIRSNEVRELEQLANSYPYSQTLRALIARGYENSDFQQKQSKIGIAAIYTTNRGVLKRFIQEGLAPMSEQQATSVEIPAVEGYHSDAHDQFKTNLIEEDKSEPIVENQIDKEKPEVLEALQIEPDEKPEDVNNEIMAENTSSFNESDLIDIPEKSDAEKITYEKVDKDEDEVYDEIQASLDKLRAQRNRSESEELENQNKYNVQSVTSETSDEEVQAIVSSRIATALEELENKVTGNQEIIDNQDDLYENELNEEIDDPEIIAYPEEIAEVAGLEEDYSDEDVQKEEEENPALQAFQEHNELEEKDAVEKLPVSSPVSDEDEIYKEIQANLDKLRKQRELVMEDLDKTPFKTEEVSELKEEFKDQIKAETEEKVNIYLPEEEEDKLIEELKQKEETKEINIVFEKQKEQLEIIERFIQASPRISRLDVNSTVENTEQEDLSEKYSEIGNQLVSENLAVIMVKQKKIDKAIDIYKKLIWKFPQKKAYFAQKIEELKQS